MRRQPKPLELSTIVPILLSQIDISLGLFLAAVASLLLVKMLYFVPKLSLPILDLPEAFMCSSILSGWVTFATHIPRKSPGASILPKLLGPAECQNLS